MNIIRSIKPTKEYLYFKALHNAKKQFKYWRSVHACFTGKDARHLKVHLNITYRGNIAFLKLKLHKLKNG